MVGSRRDGPTFANTPFWWDHCPLSSVASEGRHMYVHHDVDEAEGGRLFALTFRARPSAAGFGTTRSPCCRRMERLAVHLGGGEGREALPRSSASKTSRSSNERLWRYNIRYSKKQMEAGLPLFIEDSQGEENVWYTGGTLLHWNIDAITDYNHELARA